MRRSRARVWCREASSVLAAIAGVGCAPSKPATEPASAEREVKAEDGSSRFKEDAVAAVVKVAGQWALLGVSSGAKEAPSGWHRHAASGTCMPKGSASWALAKEQTYAPNDESVSVWNEALKTEVTLYTFPARHPFDAEFESVVGQLSHTCTEGPVMSTATMGAHFAACVRRLDDGPLLVEQVVLLQKGQWLHQARITFLAGTENEAYTPAMSVVSEAFAPCAEGAGGPP